MSSEQRTETLGPRQRLVFPLDVPDWESARSLVDALKESVGYFKVGLELFYSSGPDCIRELRKITGDRAGVFLDLKLHDIPATVSRAMAVIDRLGADLVTVHAGDGQAIIRAAKKSAKQSKILAVTVLTSVDLKENLGLDPKYSHPLELVLLRARLAREAGCDGLVCSGVEAGPVRRELGPGPLIVTPGIRPAWSLVEGDDQKRIVTPASAIKDGSDLLVVGRPIRDAADPAEAAAKVTAEIEDALK